MYVLSHAEIGSSQQQHADAVPFPKIFNVKKISQNADVSELIQSLPVQP